MGKIRLKTIGDEETEKQEKKKAEVKRAEKLSREKSAQDELNLASQGDPLEPGQLQSEQKDKTEEANQTESSNPKAESSKPAKKKSKFTKAKKRSANYKSKVMEIDKAKIYSLSEALPLLRKVKMAKFDETVELHINTIEPGISGMVKLPHGTGKEIKVAVANDEIIAEVEKGKISFDVLIAQPETMAKLAKVARILGPKGLMPNPKNGTISQNPEEAAKKFQGGQISFKTEAKNPLLHVSVGKTSFSDEELTDNIQTLIQAVKKDRIAKVVLKSTMSPGIRLAV